jgi:hypothetical protein
MEACSGCDRWTHPGIDSFNPDSIRPGVAAARR